MAKNKKLKPERAFPLESEKIEEEAGSPLIFISHDGRDADLAEAFAMLLTDASGGILKSFRSSDKSGTAGIEFGTEWYGAIMQKLDEATDVVALLTIRSLNRPWILYETGVAKGKLDRTVFGLALGVPLEKAAVGPFAQFQNSGDDEDSITKLVLQLIRRHPDAAPREEAIRRQVEAFKKHVANLLKSRNNETITEKAGSSDVSVAKLFEEIKLQIRDLPAIADAVRQLQSGLQSPIVVKPPSKITLPRRRYSPNASPMPVEIVVGDKQIKIKIARTWQSYLSKLGWPDDTSQVREFFSEVGHWFSEEPNRLVTKGTISISHGSGQVNIQPNGILLNNFKQSVNPPAA